MISWPRPLTAASSQQFVSQFQTSIELLVIVNEPVLVPAPVAGTLPVPDHPRQMNCVAPPTIADVTALACTTSP